MISPPGKREVTAAVPDGFPAGGLAAETLYAGLASAARSRMERIAVVDDEGTMTYGELLDAVHALSAALTAGPAGPLRVGVSLDSSRDTAVAYFACHHAGAIYVPLGGNITSRSDGLAAWLSLDAVISRRSNGLAVRQVTPGKPAAAGSIVAQRDPGEPAHLLLTSGTTSGQAKAVFTDQTGSILSHRWRSRLCPYRPDDVVGCNIFGVWDLVPALLSGVPAVMIGNDAIRDPAGLAGAIVRHGITRMLLTPSLLNACLGSASATAALGQLRLIVLCGEVARRGVLDRALALLPAVRLLNLYSLSECHDVAAGFVGADSDSLTPADFCELLVVDADDRDRPVARGHEGRIIVGGRGLGLGYLGDTGTGFFTRDGRRYYDTGDRGRLDANGALTVSGRLDSLRKVRGSWVNLDEVESALFSYPDVEHAVAFVEHDRLVARVTGMAARHRRRLHRHLARRLSGTALPDRIQMAGSVDLAPSGKAARNPSLAVEGNLEARILALYRRILRDDCLGPDSGFHDSGGTSLDAVELAGAIERDTGKSVTVAQLYRLGSARRLARFLRDARDQPRLPWRFPSLSLPRIQHQGRKPGEHALVTGARGFIGSRLARRLGPRCIEGTRETLPLDKPLLGMDRKSFLELGRRLGAVFHTAARVDPFAGFSTLSAVNVTGTLAVARLAAVNRAPLVHLSSSGVFPLGSARLWRHCDRVSGGLARSLQASGADAYSGSKLGSELAIQAAADAGLDVRIVRIPHLLGHPLRDRLMDTLAVLVAAGIRPEGDWFWQYTAAGPVLDMMLQPVAPGLTVEHVACAPVNLADLVEALGLELRPVPLAAVYHAVGTVSRSSPVFRHAATLGQLVREYGPAPALCLNEPMIEHGDGDGDPLAVFARAWRERTSREVR